MNKFYYGVFFLFILTLIIYTDYIINRSIGLISSITTSTNPDPEVPKHSEIVMPLNSTIKAVTKTGEIIIKSGNGLKRYYQFDGVVRSVVKWPREERWYGSLGLYYPGSGYHWSEHNGISRCSVEEGQLHFKAVEDAMLWIKKQKGFNPTVYRDDGLVVSYGKNLARKQLNVDVFQIYINDSRPKKLEGSNNSMIITSW